MDKSTREELAKIVDSSIKQHFSTFVEKLTKQLNDLKTLSKLDIALGAAGIFGGDDSNKQNSSNKQADKQTSKSDDDVGAKTLWNRRYRKKMNDQVRKEIMDPDNNAPVATLIRFASSGYKKFFKKKDEGLSTSTALTVVDTNKPAENENDPNDSSQLLLEYNKQAASASHIEQVVRSSDQSIGSLLENTNKILTILTQINQRQRLMAAYTTEAAKAQHDTLHDIGSTLSAIHNFVCRPLSVDAIDVVEQPQVENVEDVATIHPVQQTDEQREEQRMYRQTMIETLRSIDGKMDSLLKISTKEAPKSLLDDLFANNQASGYNGPSLFDAGLAGAFKKLPKAFGGVVNAAKSLAGFGKTLLTNPATWAGLAAAGAVYTAVQHGEKNFNEANKEVDKKGFVRIESIDNQTQLQAELEATEKMAETAKGDGTDYVNAVTAGRLNQRVKVLRDSLSVVTDEKERSVLEERIKTLEQAIQVKTEEVITANENEDSEYQTADELEMQHVDSNAVDVMNKAQSIIDKTSEEVPSQAKVETPDAKSVKVELPEHNTNQTAVDETGISQLEQAKMQDRQTQERNQEQILQKIAEGTNAIVVNQGSHDVVQIIQQMLSASHANKSGAVPDRFLDGY